MGGNENASFIEDKGLIVVVALQSPSLFEIADGLLEIAILELNEAMLLRMVGSVGLSRRALLRSTSACAR